MNDKIVIRKANQHNLKNVSLELPKNELIVFTGISGSGKSSLAFDTIFAEGQRRYVESLSNYARQFLGQLDKPDVESIEGLSPAISIDQKSTSNNPRSTVGTVTEIYDYLRLLFARIGTPYCPNCGCEIAPQSIDEIIDKIFSLPEGTKIQLLSPIIRGKKGEYSSLFEELKQEGFVRVRVDGEIYNLDEDEIEINKTQKHTIDVVIDRLVIKESAKARLTDSAQIALEKSDGLLVVDVIGGKEMIFSEKLACPNCNLSFEELAPRIFSFNSPYGACETCSGLGAHYEMDASLLIPDPKKSLKQGAIYPWAKTGNQYYQDVLISVCDHFGIDIDSPFEDLPKQHQDIILYGRKERVKLRFKEFGGTRYVTQTRPFVGVIPYFMNKYNESNSEDVRDSIQEYMSQIPCPDCKGARLKPFSLAVKIMGKNIYDVTLLSIKDAYKFFSDLYLELDDYKLTIAKQILEEIRARLKFMLDVGLSYLNLARMSGTLSGGEAQRIRLATQIGSGLSGVLYVLDEPSIGLHQYNNDMLIKTLIRLRNLGNTLIVVEHDEEIMRECDYIVDIGPGAGVHGGELIACAEPEYFIKNAKTLTADYLSGRKKIIVPKIRRTGTGKYIEVKGCTENNLKNIDVKIPLGTLSIVTGVSGSGKSTLVNDILAASLQRKLYRSKNYVGCHESLTGVESIEKVIVIDQSPIGRTPRSNPATYTGVFDNIRDLFAETLEAKKRGYTKSRFSFNVKGGRCEKCGGDGVIKISMHFLPDVYIPCEACHGSRYNRETLEVRYKDKSIADVLDMTVEEASKFFENIPTIYPKVKTMLDVGLGYIKLGQPATTLSGGEAQRVKLASELHKKIGENTVVFLDEPTTGLHSDDINKLVQIIQKMVDTKATVVVIEHNLDVIKVADYIIDLGPEGGDGGGTIVASGTPEEVAKVRESYTGQYLKKVL